MLKTQIYDPHYVLYLFPILSLMTQMGEERKERSESTKISNKIPNPSQEC
jgi:hypothetical protein